MNKKIITILALLVVVTSISAVSAFDFNDIFGHEENKTVDVGGIKFNIPAGFQNDTTNTTQEINTEFKKLGLNATARLFIKDSDGIGIYVANYTNLGLNSSEVLNSFEGNTTTINNITGHMNDNNGTHMFTYVKNGCVVLIISTNKNLIKDVIIA